MRRYARETTVHLTARPSVLLAFPALVASLAGQGRPTRHGLWFDLGVGNGWTRSSCDACSSGPLLSDGGFFLALGGTPTPHFRVGCTLEAWFRSLTADTTALLGLSTVSLDYYPRAHGGLYVVGEVGFANAEVGIFGRPNGDHVIADSGVAGGLGWGLTAGVGYEMSLSQTFLLTPRVAYAYAAVPGIWKQDGSVLRTGWKEGVLSLALGLRFQERRRVPS